MSDRPKWLILFADESNKIEGMPKARMREIEALEEFLACDELTIAAVETYVKLVAPGHRLRRQVGLNVRVGDHVAPPGGPDIEDGLAYLLATWETSSPFANHVAYETVHPFTDGNGRSGRAIWLWQHIRNGTDARPKALGFLHSFYYETLSNSRPKSPSGSEQR